MVTLRYDGSTPGSRKSHSKTKPDAHLCRLLLQYVFICCSVVPFSKAIDSMWETCMVAASTGITLNAAECKLTRLCYYFYWKQIFTVTSFSRY